MSLTITRDEGPNDVYFKHESFIVSDGDELAYFRKAENAELFVKAKSERDPTPLTVEVLVAMGAIVVKNGLGEALAKFKANNGNSIRVEGFSKNTEWYMDNYRGTISTVGELRMLARLAGVELKGGGS